MLLTNPFSEIATTIPPVFMQAFVIIMILSVIISTLLDMAHKKNAKYFFINLKKSKEAAKRKVSASKKTSIIVKTVASDIMTTSELGVGQRRIAHLLGMYGSIIFWITSFTMIFFYSSPSIITPNFLTILWHLGALMTCLGGYWFWFFLRVDVSAEGHSWSRVIRADLFVLSLVLTPILSSNSVATLTASCPVKPSTTKSVSLGLATSLTAAAWAINS